MRLLLSAFIIFISITTWGASEPLLTSFELQKRFPVQKFKLSNGLTVILHEDHSAPIISYHQWFRVGSRYEKVGKTGLAHFFEHYMFKGTQKIPGEKLEWLIQSNGGRNNAFTTRDFTGYYTNLPSGKLELIIKIESDRMHNLVFDPAKIQKEREVVKEERRMRTENSIEGLLYEALFQTVFKVHPYRWPVIGSMKDLNAMTIQDFENFYKTYYAPNNAIVVVAGDFDSQRARKLLEKYYGPIPPQKIPKLSEVKEPEQRAPRRTIRQKDVRSITLAVAFKGPAAGTKDSYALDLLSTILGEGESSRLYRRLAYREQRVTSISSWSYSLRDAGVFAIMAYLKPGERDSKVLRSIYGELYKLRNYKVSDKELEKAKILAMKGTVDSLKTISSRANTFALNEIYFNDYSRAFSDLEKFLSITKEDLLAVAQKYLAPEKRSVILVQPFDKKRGHL